MNTKRILRKLLESDSDLKEYSVEWHLDIPGHNGLKHIRLHAKDEDDAVEKFSSIFQIGDVVKVSEDTYKVKYSLNYPTQEFERWVTLHAKDEDDAFDKLLDSIRIDNITLTNK